MHKPRYNVAEFYHETGIAQAVARSQKFENFTLSVISFNSIWISIDSDNNTAVSLTDAQPVFIIAENFFCTFFTLELTVRFLAFRLKRKAFRDAWFRQVAKHWLIEFGWLIRPSSTSQRPNQSVRTG